MTARALAVDTQDDRLSRAALRIDPILASLWLIGFGGLISPFTWAASVLLLPLTSIALGATKRAYARDIPEGTQSEVEGIAFWLAVLFALGTLSGLAVGWDDLDRPSEFAGLGVALLCTYLSWSALRLARRWTGDLR